jgi:hypothetical protein
MIRYALKLCNDTNPKLIENKKLGTCTIDIRLWGFVSLKLRKLKNTEC